MKSKSFSGQQDCFGSEQLILSYTQSTDTGSLKGDLIFRLLLERLSVGLTLCIASLGAPGVSDCRCSWKAQREGSG